MPLCINTKSFMKLECICTNLKYDLFCTEKSMKILNFNSYRYFFLIMEYMNIFFSVWSWPNKMYFQPTLWKDKYQISKRDTDKTTHSYVEAISLPLSDFCVYPYLVPFVMVVHKCHFILKFGKVLFYQRYHNFLLPCCRYKI